MSQPTKTDKYLSAAAVIAALLVGGYATMQGRPKPRTVDAPTVNAVPIAAGRTVARPKPKASPVAAAGTAPRPDPTATPYDDAKAFLDEGDNSDVRRIEKEQRTRQVDAQFADHQALSETTRLTGAIAKPRFFNADGTPSIIRQTTPEEDEESGATAVCRDGTLSYSQNRRGTCSHHGGVRRWL